MSQQSCNEISRCEVCGNEALQPVLDLGLHPLCDDLIPVGDQRICDEFPISILYCDKCFTAHQKFQVPKRQLFPENYHYRSRFTADVLKGMEELVLSCKQRFGDLSGKMVVDVGCNDGSLLDFFADETMQTIGIEPTDAHIDASKKGHIVISDYFSSSVAEQISAQYGAPDLITFTNVFAHIEDLDSVLKALKILMGDHTVIVIENHYLGAVLDKVQFDTFYHEHPRTYSATSFAYIAKSLGLAPLGIEFPSRYGGNIRVFMGNPGLHEIDKEEYSDVHKREETFGNDFETLQSKITYWRLKMSKLIDNYVKLHGPLKAKAFPGRAAILVKLLGLDTDSISEVFEKPGSMKIGHYLPGTRIPIKSDNDFDIKSDDNAVLLNLAWHISKEIHSYLRSRGFNGEIIDILNSDIMQEL